MISPSLRISVLQRHGVSLLLVTECHHCVCAALSALLVLSSQQHLLCAHLSAVVTVNIHDKCSRGLVRSGKLGDNWSQCNPAIPFPERVVPLTCVRFLSFSCTVAKARRVRRDALILFLTSWVLGMPISR